MGGQDPWPLTIGERVDSLLSVIAYWIQYLVQWATYDLSRLWAVLATLFLIYVYQVLGKTQADLKETADKLVEAEKTPEQKAEEEKKKAEEEAKAKGESPPPAEPPTQEQILTSAVDALRLLETMESIDPRTDLAARISDLEMRLRRHTKEVKK